MRVMIIGASGLLGKPLMQQWKETDVVAAPSSKEVDIRNAESVRDAVRKNAPEWIVLTAAYTDVDGCETNVEHAFAVNRDGPGNVAKAAKETGSRLLFISSDYVFDGAKKMPYETDDPRNPQSVYGRTKAEAEVKLLELMPKCCIVRTSWLFGIDGKCFPDTILKLAANRSSLDVVNDQRGSPTYATDLASALVRLCRKNASGIVHATNADDCTWFEFAREIVRNGGLKTEVRPVSSEQFPRPARRPAYSVLSQRSLNALRIEMPSWRDALSRYLKHRPN
jgi:dTDP-4-dehydrorhamnose reductase